MYAYGAGNSGAENIVLPDVYSCQPVGGLLPLPRVWFHNTVKVHAWTGVKYEEENTAAENQPMVYVCYDNGAYMNTGIQRSSATPKFADTTTSPAGTVIPGKMQSRKDLTEVMEAHHLPYVAQTIAYANFKDLYEKAEKAIYTEGPCFLNVLSPCPRGWGYPTDMLMQINKLAVETCYWPLYEVIDGRYVINYKPAKKLPIEEFLKPQKRFKHMFKPGNEWMIEEFQKEVDKRWEALLKLEETTNR